MTCLLVVDDERAYREIIAEFLRDQPYELVFAQDGWDAWELLNATPGRFDAVLMDRVMPRMDGMEVLRRIKADARFAAVPVIVQTAAVSPDEVADGLAAGAWYYLAKPYDELALNGIVRAALSDRGSRQALARMGDELHGMLAMMRQGRYEFRLPQEAKTLGTALARLCPNEGAVAMGLTELMLNAIEHGNLGINYEGKGRLIADGLLREEVERRLALPEQADRWGTLEFSRSGHCLLFTVSDQGSGFDWNRYLELDPARAFDCHGRGIAMARMLAFSSLDYHGIGNVVTAAVDLNGKEKP